MTSPRILLHAGNLKAKKQLGQNFLSDPAFCAMLAEKSRLDPNDTVLEIGAGLGSLTMPIADRVRQVFAVEKDRDLAAILREQLFQRRIEHVRVIEADILRTDIEELAQEAGRPLVVMGNLPYNISSPVLIRLIQNRQFIERAVLMFQKELADRLTASPGSRDYGRITVILRYCADIRPLAKASAHLFYPKPQVDSEVVEIVFQPVIENPADDEALLIRVIQAAFGQRRKTLKNALSAGLPQVSAPRIEQWLQQAGIDPIRRAETLGVPEFVRLSNLLSRRQCPEGRVP